MSKLLVLPLQRRSVSLMTVSLGRYRFSDLMRVFAQKCTHLTVSLCHKLGLICNLEFVQAYLKLRNC